jgi:protoporphyrin/coproporphyrin ferrochelatase
MNLSQGDEMHKKGVLLINLGTPEQCDQSSVRNFLREFLLDPRVINLPFFIRWPLVNLFIVPFRSKKTWHAYQKIWHNTSPLLRHSQHLQKMLAEELKDDYHVVLGMRYGQPSIEQALHQLKDYQHIIILPLFPQYSEAATGSALEQALQQAKKWPIAELSIKKDFYNHPAFIAAYADLINTHLKHQDIDLLLLSYHGLPERHLDNSQCSSACNKINACPAHPLNHLLCYRAQCYETSRLLATALKLNDYQYQVSFQSRLGRTPWIKPYTDLLLPDLIKKGIKNIAIACPSFVVDCLETLEEINIRAREQWMSLGGKNFVFIPCLNSQNSWVKGLSKIITEE